MFCEDKQNRERRAVTYAALHCAVLGRKYTSRRARFYLRIAEDDPPEHPARPPLHNLHLEKLVEHCSPHNTLPATAGKARAGPWPVRHFAARGGDG